MTNPLCRRIPNNLCRYSTLKEVESHSLLLKCQLYKVTSFQRVQMEREKRRLSIPGKYHLSQLSKVNMNGDVMLIVCTLDMI